MAYEFSSLVDMGSSEQQGSSCKLLTLGILAEVLIEWVWEGTYDSGYLVAHILGGF